MADYQTASVDLTTAITHLKPTAAFKAGLPVRSITVIGLPDVTFDGTAVRVVGYGTL